ncbi:MULTISPECIES: NAD(P)/FAD-dependent oxidoreductase [unclassified Oleiphilus]|jgi:cation diffusion facilitator CzcD-associated flavoprotein CzcO|nr:MULTISPECIES: NAD(P)/FAD-dependent oxidoreductase [unclassified Oleiphilus]KZY41005.1 monooxygenase [Oleiphilus sp. HI0050]KZY81814.1 monooxygenase [Oleiphilus sp. HI0069]KZY96393.1 monooxygenase [Oleiphilus sp. HI0072]KZZ32479.1 monooxygenase [Oleiphilus sp. HI0085]KZY39271.1 monooxygenase [Oleiphilus sp. HI0043]
MKQDYQVIIIGSGFGGQLAAMNLIKRGIQDFLILERREFVGGTWSQNTYPGAAVDVPSPLYSISSEPYNWSQMFAEQDELREYTEHIISKHALDKKIAAGSNVSKIEWQEAEQRWQIDIEGKDAYHAQFVINASGPLSTPVIPDFPGKDTFKGKSFHSNNWDHNYDHKGKRVAVIGSGASAAQIIPAIAPEVEHLDVLQRTPHWVMPRNDYKFKGWQRKLLSKSWAYFALRFLIYWWYEFRVIGFKYSDLALKVLAKNKAEKHIRKQIKDPDLQRKVTPDFTIGCKRVILSDTLYPAYCRDNVTLFDKNNGIKEITEKGIVTQDGVEHELDLIVYSTGYDATDGVISYPVVGKGGKTLAQAWSDFPRAYLGTSAPGFPNLFIVTGPNTGIGHTSALFIIESQMKYIMNSISALKQSGKKVIEVNVDAEEKYTDLIHHEMAKTVWQRGGCNSWYKSKSGKVIAMFPGFSFTFRRWAKKFKRQDHSFNS